MPTPRNKVNQLVQFFENKPTPPPRTGKWENVKPKPVPRKSVNEDIILPPPIPEGKPAWESSQPKITQLQKALRNSTKSFIVDVIDNEDLLHQLNETKNFIKKCLVKELLDLKGFKYVETLKVTLGKKQGNGITTSFIIKDHMKPKCFFRGCDHKMETSIAKRNFPSCSLRSQFTASQKPPLLFPNASILETNCVETSSRYHIKEPFHPLRIHSLNGLLDD